MLPSARWSPCPPSFWPRHTIALTCRWGVVEILVAPPIIPGLQSGGVDQVHTWAEDTSHRLGSPDTAANEDDSNSAVSLLSQLRAGTEHASRDPPGWLAEGHSKTAPAWVCWRCRCWSSTPMQHLQKAPCTGTVAHDPRRGRRRRLDTHSRCRRENRGRTKAALARSCSGSPPRLSTRVARTPLADSCSRGAPAAHLHADGERGHAGGIASTEVGRHQPTLPSFFSKDSSDLPLRSPATHPSPCRTPSAQGSPSLPQGPPRRSRAGKQEGTRWRTDRTTPAPSGC